MEPEKEDERDVHGCKAKITEGKVEPKRECSTLKQSFQRADTGVEAPGQLRLPGRDMQQTAVDS